MVWVVALLLQRLPEAALDVRFTLPPAQKVVGPPGVMEGVGGVGFTVTVTGAETADVQPAATSYTVNVPLVVTLIDDVVAPLLQLLPEAALEVSVTLPPEQMVVDPLGVMVGVGGMGFTVTTTGVETAEVQPAAISTTV
jgi:hypothetical protein